MIGVTPPGTLIELYATARADNTAPAVVTQYIVVVSPAWRKLGRPVRVSGDWRNALPLIAGWLIEIDLPVGVGVVTVQGWALVDGRLWIRPP